MLKLAGVGIVTVVALVAGCAKIAAPKQPPHVQIDPAVLPYLNSQYSQNRYRRLLLAVQEEPAREFSASISLKQALTTTTMGVIEDPHLMITQAIMIRVVPLPRHDGGPCNDGFPQPLTPVGIHTAIRACVERNKIEYSDNSPSSPYMYNLFVNNVLNDDYYIIGFGGVVGTAQDLLRFWNEHMDTVRVVSVVEHIMLPQRIFEPEERLP